MSVQILQEIAQTEREAEEIRKRAVQEARQLVAEAREKSRRQQEETLVQVEGMAQDMLSRAEEAVGQEIQRIKGRTDEECTLIRQKAAARLETAVDIIIGRIVKTHGDR